MHGQKFFDINHDIINSVSRCFPETKVNNGIIESHPADISNMHSELQNKYSSHIPGRLLLKMESHLDIAGSVKARGGIYEVLRHAEDLAIKHDILNGSAHIVWATWSKMVPDEVF